VFDTFNLAIMGVSHIRNNMLNREVLTIIYIGTNVRIKVQGGRSSYPEYVNTATNTTGSFGSTPSKHPTRKCCTRPNLYIEDISVGRKYTMLVLLKIITMTARCCHSLFALIKFVGQYFAIDIGQYHANGEDRRWSAFVEILEFPENDKCLLY
jgi:hypothetical protein